MTPEQIQALIDRLLNSAEILSSKGFELAYQQILLSARLDIFWGIVFLIAGIIVAVLSWKYQEELEEFVIVTGCFSGMCLFIFAMNISEAYSYLNNPAWYAVKLLVKTFIK